MRSRFHNHMHTVGHNDAGVVSVNFSNFGVRLCLVVVCVALTFLQLLVVVCLPPPWAYGARRQLRTLRTRCT